MILWFILFMLIAIKENQYPLATLLMEFGAKNPDVSTAPVPFELSKVNETKYNLYLPSPTCCV